MCNTKTNYAKPYKQRYRWIKVCIGMRNKLGHNEQNDD